MDNWLEEKNEMTIETEFLKFFNSDRAYWGYGEYIVGDKPFGISLPGLLNIKEDNIKPYGKALLENLAHEELFIELIAGIRAYSQFQDIFVITLFDTDNLTNRHYCFFESLVYIRESVVSWLDKNVLAALVLLRPFLELSILHVYWYLRCEQNSYAIFYEWLNGNDKIKPPFRNMIDYVFSHLPSKDVLSKSRTNRIKDLIYNGYKGHCFYNHAPQVSDSITSLGGGRD